jgi:5-methylcytosine-specific restriction endonuclease McrA
MKNIYKGGSRPLETNCGQGRCPANSKLIKVLHYEKNKEEYKARARSQPAEKLRDYKRAWKARNKGAVAENVSSRKKHIRLATPHWLTKAHKTQIKAFYLEAERLKSQTGIDHEVDHIVPVRGGIVSGLHVPWNLRVITAAENQSKNRRLIEDLSI